MLRAINVWAFHEESDREVPLGYCRSAPLPAPGAPRRPRRLSWHLFLPFASLADLARRLSDLALPPELGGGRLADGELQRLAIECHAEEGALALSGRGRSRPRFRAQDIPGSLALLRRIGVKTAGASHVAYDPLLAGSVSPNPSPLGLPRAPGRREQLAVADSFDASTVLLMACNAGSRQAGSRLLEGLSRVWDRERLVVGFSALVDVQLSLQNPGRLTACHAPVEAAATDRQLMNQTELAAFRREYEAGRRGDRANEDSAMAKWAKNGRIVRQPCNERLGDPRAAARQPGSACLPAAGTPAQRSLAR